MSRFVRVACFSVCLLLATFLPTVWLGGAPPTDKEVAKVSGVLEELRENWENGTLDGQTYHLTEPELNSYLSSQLRQQDSGPVKDLSLSLTEGGLQVRLQLDPEQLDSGEDTLTGGVLRWLLGKTPSLEVDGQLQAEKGRGSFSMEQARLNGMPLPANLMEKLLETVGYRQDLAVDLTQSFELPYGIDSIVCRPGSVSLLTRSSAEPLTQLE